MRVIAGAAKGRRLKAPPGRDTRPTTDRVKEAVFSMLQPDLPGARVLDLYAGSGALGIEALSRGAEHATFVERGRRAGAVLHENLAETGFFERATVVAADVEHVLAGAPPIEPYDVVLLDPPYDTPASDVVAVLTALVPHLAPRAVVVLERGAHDEPVEWPPSLSSTRHRRYGDTVLQTARLAQAEGDGR